MRLHRKPNLMTRLYLLRHAKAAWAQPGMRDLDRPLDAEGRRDAEALGGAMLARDYLADRIFCSTALRARQTWAGVSAILGGRADSVVYSDALYSSDATGYLAIIRGAGDAGSILVIGHNPMMEDLSLALAGDGEASARSSVASGFPACGLAVIRFPGSLAEAAPGKGHLEAFLTPAGI